MNISCRCDLDYGIVLF